MFTDVKTQGTLADVKLELEKKKAADAT